MSNIRADQVGPSAGGTLRDLVRGVAGMWINFSGITNVVAGSVNVSSLVDNGTGNYTVMHTASFSGAYAVSKTDDNLSVGGVVNTAAWTGVYTRNTTMALADTGLLAVIAHGSLA